MVTYTELTEKAAATALEFVTAHVDLTEKLLGAQKDLALRAREAAPATAAESSAKG